MTTPKRHHFIPRMHLQHFVGPEPQGQVWTYDAQTDQVRSAVPEQTAFESHFYSVEATDGTMNTAIEAKLAEIEGQAAPAYEALLRCEIPGETQARMDFSTFLAVMYLRTPAMRRMSAETISRNTQIKNYAYGVDEKAFEGLARRFEAGTGQTLTSEQKEQLHRDLIDPSGYVLEIPKERTLAVLGGSDKLTPLFFKMKWSVVLPAHGFFITTDNPLVRQVDRKTWHPIYGDGGFFNKTAEIIFPLSPQRLLLLSWEKNIQAIGAFERQHVERVNKTLAAHSDRYLYSHIRDKRLQQLARSSKAPVQ